MSTLAMVHIRVLAEDIGVRAAGSENEAAAARYARTYLKGLGYTVDTIPVGLPKGLVSHNIRAVKREPLLSPSWWARTLTARRRHRGRTTTHPVWPPCSSLRVTSGTRTPPPPSNWSCSAPRRWWTPTPGHHHYGARAFVKEMTPTERANLAGMMSVDMIAYGSRFTVGTMKRGPQLLCTTLMGYAGRHGLQAAFQRDEGTYGWSDHEPFELAGYPVAWLEWGDDPTYHTASDTFTHCDPKPVKKTGDLLLGFLTGLSRADLERLLAAR